MAVEPSPSAEPDPAAELARAAELREGWGLRSDREWIMQVAADPASVISPDLGIPVTQQELAELARMFAEEPIGRLTAYGMRHPDQFGGLYLEGGSVTMMFTGDLELHQAAVAALSAGRPIRLIECRFSTAELEAVMDDVQPQFLDIRPDFQPLGLGIDTKRNVVSLEAKSNNPGLKQELEAPYDGALDATIYPLPGPWTNTPAGDGWRLLFAGNTQGGDFAYAVRAARDEAEWRALWRGLALGGEGPVVDMREEIVVLFGHGMGSSCPELRLDDVVIEPEMVYSLTSDPLQPRVCTDDLAGAAVFVVALERAHLADSFTLRLQHPSGCPGCGSDPSLEVDLRP